MWIRVTLGLAAMLISGVAQAKDLRGADYYLPKCKSIFEHREQVDVAAGACLGIITALTDLSPFFETPFKFCPPPQLDPATAMLMVVQYIEQKASQKLKEPFIGLAIEALQETFPCKK